MAALLLEPFGGFSVCRLPAFPRGPHHASRCMGEARAQVAGFSFPAMREKPVEGEAH